MDNDMDNNIQVCMLEIREKNMMKFSHIWVGIKKAADMKIGVSTLKNVQILKSNF